MKPSKRSCVIMPTRGKGDPNAKNIAFVPDESPAPLGLLTNHVRGKGGIAKKKI